MKRYVLAGLTVLILLAVYSSISYIGRGEAAVLDPRFGDPAILPTFLLSEAAAEDVKVVLSGEGAAQKVLLRHRFSFLVAGRDGAQAPYGPRFKKIGMVETLEAARANAAKLNYTGNAASVKPRKLGVTALRDISDDYTRRFMQGTVAMIEEDHRVCRAIGRHGARLIRAGARVLTHCNAGGLATADYGTALAVLFAARISPPSLPVKPTARPPPSTAPSSSGRARRAAMSAVTTRSQLSRLTTGSTWSGRSATRSRCRRARSGRSSWPAARWCSPV